MRVVFVVSCWIAVCAAAQAAVQCKTHARIALLLDTSGSAVLDRYQIINIGKTFALKVSDKSKIAVKSSGKLDFGVFTFGDDKVKTLRPFGFPKRIAPFTVAAIGALPQFIGSTPMTNATRHVVAGFAEADMVERMHNKALVILSDGVPKGPGESEASLRKAVNSAKARGIHVYTIFYGENAEGKALLKSLASGPASNFQLERASYKSEMLKGFKVILDGICAVVQAAPQCKTQARVALELDTSGSAVLDRYQMIDIGKTFALKVSDRSKIAVKSGGKLDFGVFAFGDDKVKTLRSFRSPQRIAPFTVAAIGALPQFIGNTPMTNATRLVVAKFAEADKGERLLNKALVILSDGVPKGPGESEASLRTAVENAKARGIHVYTVFYGGNAEGKALLKSLASEPASGFQLDRTSYETEMFATFKTILDGICARKVASGEISIPILVGGKLRGNFSLNVKADFKLLFPKGCPFLECKPKGKPRND